MRGSQGDKISPKTGKLQTPFAAICQNGLNKKKERSVSVRDVSAVHDGIDMVVDAVTHYDVAVE